jgi:hypothetical protein
MKFRSIKEISNNFFTFLAHLAKGRNFFEELDFDCLVFR